MSLEFQKEFPAVLFPESGHTPSKTKTIAWWEGRVRALPIHSVLGRGMALPSSTLGVNARWIQRAWDPIPWKCAWENTMMATTSASTPFLWRGLTHEKKQHQHGNRPIGVLLLWLHTSALCTLLALSRDAIPSEGSSDSKETIRVWEPSFALYLWLTTPVTFVVIPKWSLNWTGSLISSQAIFDLTIQMCFVKAAEY